MDFLELARARKTTYEFDPRMVPDPVIQEILEAGRWAPSCSNLQPWHFIIIKDPERIAKIMMTANYGDFHTDPPLMIAIAVVSERCSEKNHLCFRGKNENVHDSFMCAGMAGLNMAYQAKVHGIENCMITVKQEETKELLTMEKDDFVALVVGFGYPKEGAYQKERERLPLSRITSCESMENTGMARD